MVDRPKTVVRNRNTYEPNAFGPKQRGGIAVEDHKLIAGSVKIPAIRLPPYSYPDTWEVVKFNYSPRKYES
jgi:hypothetical protein